MDANNQSAAASADKPGLSVQQATSSSKSAADGKFAQKVSGATPPSNQGSDGSSAKKEALAKQFIASRATMGMAQPLIFRR